MLHPLFVAAILEGFEGTLDEVLDRVEDGELKVRLDVLQGHVAALRLSIERADGAHDPNEVHV
jgi:hypothetical protein